MTQVRELSIAAETRVEQMFLDVLTRLHNMTETLLTLHDKIKAAQPVSSGAVCLELYSCGKCCSGCPHPRWVKYYWLPSQGEKLGALVAINLDAHARDPVLALIRKEKHYAATAALIREAKTILKTRAVLVNAVRALHIAAKLK